MSDLPERLRVVADERDEHARWREKLADDLHDRETQISDAWQALRDAGVQSEQSIADGIELMRRQLAEAEQDARRYRFIRDADRSDAFLPIGSLLCYSMDSLDDAIDAVIAQADAALK